MADGGTAEAALNWTKSLQNIPKFSSITIAEHLKNCGKSDVGGKSYKFFTENYIHDVFLREAGACWFFKGRCYRSQKKNEDPHSMHMKVESDQGRANIVESTCSCKAGIGGKCNHIFAFLYLLNHWSMLERKEIPANKTCTSIPQEWHKPRGEKIEPDPVMKCTFAKSSSDKNNKRKLDPIICKLYDARGKTMKLNGWQQENVFGICQQLSTDNTKPPFAYLLADQEYSQKINCVFGNAPLGSVLGYQLTDLRSTKTTFIVSRPDFNILPFNGQPKTVLTFPDIPLPSTESFNPPDSMPAELLHKIKVTREEACELQKKTVSQSQNKLWVKERKMRLTASNFGRVLYRKAKPSEPFLNSIFEPNDLSKVSSINHGKQNEAIGRSHYARKMQNQVHRNFTVYDCGLVVDPSFPYLGATPDGKVFDPSYNCPFGLLEIKCPYSWRHQSIEAACQDHNFFCTMNNGTPKLKPDHKTGYYAQVQGQLAVSRLSWCDFVVYLTGSRTLTVERIHFDPDYWKETLKPKLSTFYFEHAINFLQNSKSTL